MNIKIVIATHKKYEMPADSIYVPVHVGAEGKESIGFIGDNTGDNISGKNSFYCELTGLYWGWKNLDCDYLGLAHYRRHFSLKKRGGKAINSVLTGLEAKKMFEKTDVILPRKRRYYIDTLESHFNHVKYTMDSDLPMLRDAIEKIDSSYLDSFDRCIHRTYGHMFNMFIMKKELVDQYCSWMFQVLSEVEQTIDLSEELHPARRRMIGYLAEFLIDIWVDHNKVNYTEVNTIFLEKQNEFKKIYKFLIRKFRK